MHVNRSRFLALTATLASGCAPTTPPAEPQPATVVASNAVVPVEHGPPAEPFFPDEVGGTSGVGEWHGQEEGLGTMPAYPAPADEGGRPISAIARDCSQLRAPPGPHCESFASLQGDCEMIVSALEPGAAQQTMNCLLQKSGTRRVCDFLAVTSCAEKSLSHVPLRPATTSLCQTVVSRCGHGIAQHTCESFLSAVQPPNDAHLVTCLSESCSLAPCFFSI